MNDTTVREDYYKYFKYRGKGYASNTKIKIKSSYINEHTYDGKNIWPYARFSNRCSQNNKIYCRFAQCNLYIRNNSNNYCGYFLIPEEDIELLIDEIIYPVEVCIAPIRKKKDYESSEVMIGWVIVVIILTVSIIFNEWYLIWLWTIIVFCFWRNKKLLE